MKSKILKY
jgi:hypothetical protein